MIWNSAGGTDMLVSVILATGMLGGGKLENETDGRTVVLADEVQAISSSRERLHSFGRNLFRGLRELMTDSLTHKTCRSRAMVVPKEIVIGLSTRFYGEGTEVSMVCQRKKPHRSICTPSEALEKTILVLTHRDRGRRVGRERRTSFDVEQKDGGEILSELILTSQKAKVEGPHTLHDRPVMTTDPL